MESVHSKISGSGISRPRGSQRSWQHTTIDVTAANKNEALSFHRCGLSVVGRSVCLCVYSTVLYLRSFFNLHSETGDRPVSRKHYCLFFNYRIA